MDLMRQQRVQKNAALIEASFQQERAQLQVQNSASNVPSIQSQAPSTSVNDFVSLPEASSAPSRDAAEPPISDNLAPTPGAQRSGSTLPKTGSDDYQPEAWTPQLRARRG